jgi:hypothetical protein
LELDGDRDDQVVLRAAMDAGSVHEFGPERPSLLQVFHEAMSEADGDR